MMPTHMINESVVTSKLFAIKHIVTGLPHMTSALKGEVGHKIPPIFRQKVYKFCWHRGGRHTVKLRKGEAEALFSNMSFFYSWTRWDLPLNFPIFV